MSAVIEPLLTLQQVAEILGVSRAQVYALVREGLPVHRISDRVQRVSGDDLKRWLESRRATS
jgi:excisionase family DNA binding protein